MPDNILTVVIRGVTAVTPNGASVKVVPFYGRYKQLFRSRVIGVGYWEPRIGLLWMGVGS